MSGRFDDVDLSQLPQPQIVEALDFETILQALKDDLALRDPAYSAGLLESDPAVKVLEAAAYREVNLRQRVNDAARAVMLALAAGSDLDQIAGGYFKVARQVIVPGDPDAVPPVEPLLEDDERLRLRAQIAFEALSTAGPDGAYIFHALSASPLVAAATVFSPAPGDVLVTIQSTDNGGIADQALLDTVAAALSPRDLRPLTDRLTVAAASALDWSLEARLLVEEGPVIELVLAAAEAALLAYAERQGKLGRWITVDGLHKALRVEGVRKVEALQPFPEILAGLTQFPRLQNHSITAEGTP